MVMMVMEIKTVVMIVAFFPWHTTQGNMLTPVAFERAGVHGHASSECHQPRLPNGDRRFFDTVDSVQAKEPADMPCPKHEKHGCIYTHPVV